jgi:peptidoglycan glycosyltransferase
MKNDNVKSVKSIKILTVFFSVCLLSIVAYLTYFTLYKAVEVEDNSTNPRIAIAESEVLRGSILDRNGNAIAHSEGTPESQKRIYTNGKAFSFVTGYMSKTYGKTGIEDAYNEALIGNTSSYDIFATFFRTLKEDLNENDKLGANVELTIDGDTQLAAYNAMKDYTGAVAAINPSTGEVLAMVSTPTYDPGSIDKNFEQYTSDEKGAPLVNRATSGYYPPGSVFKMVTAAAAIESIGDIQQQEFVCDGGLKIGDYVLWDYGHTSHGKVDIKKGFGVSCNYTFGTIGKELGFNKLNSYAERFMFNKTITSADDIDVLNIKSGGFTISDSTSDALIAQNAIGQNGVTTNPMHMAMIAGAIANGGVMMKPYIVKSITDRYGVELMSGQSSVLSRAISPETAATVSDYMVYTVKSGTGKAVQISGVTIGGKTGSAENSQGDVTHSWFVAFAPAENPQIAVAVVAENAGTGSKAGMVARAVIKAYLDK